MLNLSYSKVDAPTVPAGSAASNSAVSGTVAITSTKTEVKQLAIDDKLDKEDGLIPRKKTNLCKHTQKGMCEYCSPLPPWDKGYQQEHNIKHISFHARIGELNALTNKGEGSSYIPPLSETSFKINKKCPSGHDPWPKGICSKCQPSAITLQRQNFRMVDHVEFQDSEVINNFINAWRLSGSQRIGLMFGSYDNYDKVPLGIKAKVEAIFELPQLDNEDGLILQNWEDGNKVMELTERLGLIPVGIIYTDLSDAGKGDGSVICKRHKDSFFMSSLELIFSVKWQLKYPNICKWCDSGKFSSKFVTCIISGNTSGEIDIEAYQASESAEALVKADLISPSTHPNQVYINEQTDERYVPEIFYQMINEYGLQVKNNAKPSFPVEYLLVSLTHGFPEKSDSFFKSTEPFPIENRGYIGESADMNSVKKYFANCSSNAELLCNRLSNLHAVYFLLNGLDILGKEDYDRIVDVVSSKGESLVSAYRLMESPGWLTLQTILANI
ncbi:unnamed protein product [Ambrosiozyma monospora]|uniref:Nuclear protein localization protein 4 n=1 Tax=Ambrosiozyma monospora TaxID=43982 RepID=A0A9W7DEJ2_AMBMO|nr:unnamed protein product [Ambrosiozyma monospora]